MPTGELICPVHPHKLKKQKHDTQQHNEQERQKQQHTTKHNRQETKTKT